MKSKVYTLTGDQGKTSLVGGKRVDKDDVRVEAYGTIDELNAHIGLLAHNSKLEATGLSQDIRIIQNKLFNIGAYLATEVDEGTPVHGLGADDVHRLEHCIDTLDEQLPPMQGFILPGGSRLSAQCDICRTVARRAERRIITLSKQGYVAPEIIQFINRLSDFFFVFARFANFQNQTEEIYWDKDL